MKPSFHSLDPLSLPLAGSGLIEASAGTGKTYTIAALYVRLVLGLSCTARVPAEILVMTFTKAATRELAERIRSRLLEVARVLGGEAPAAEDRFVQDLLQVIPAGPDRAEAIWRLGQAAESIDESAIHTIDAWCQQMLREHAFDSGCLFDEELQSDERALLGAAAADYWRQEVVGLPEQDLDAVSGIFKSLDDLQRRVRDSVLHGAPVKPSDDPLRTVVSTWRQSREERLRSIKAAWPAHIESMRQWFAAIHSNRQHPAVRHVATASKVSQWLAQLQSWADQPSAASPGLSSAAQVRLSGRALRAVFSEAHMEADWPGQGVPPCFDAWDGLLPALAALPNLERAAVDHAAAGIRARMQALKLQSGRFGFADMLNRLDAALDPRIHGRRADRLRGRILSRFPVALIDEFQDTSPVQLSIFDRLYRMTENDPQRCLLLIGDPKQAIYGFRGADIRSYLQARSATAGRHYALARNHRSTQAVVDVVNRLFGQAESRSGAGAFLMGSDQARADAEAATPLPFWPVEARGRSERLETADGVVPALTIVFDPAHRNRDDSQDLCAALCAQRIAHLLKDPEAGFRDAGGPLRPLRPADIAVLVRDRHEARAVRSELARRRLLSVYLSDKESIFESPQALDVLRLLQAAAAPSDAALVRSALATPLMAWGLEALQHLAHDETLFDAQCERFRQLNAVWSRQGVLPMMRAAVHQLAMASRWHPDVAERWMTNVLHLAELLQAVSAQVEGLAALVRWLARQIADAQSGLSAAEQEMRLESDEDRIKVVSIHSAKGLEYPVVFLPFVSRVRAAEDDDTALRPGLADEERLQEDLRLLYVGLTRARHALWLGLSGTRFGSSKTYGWHRSAIGCLFSGPDERPFEQREQDVRAFAESWKGSPSHVKLEVLVDADPAAHAPLMAGRERLKPDDLLPVPRYTGTFDRNWSISSYSGLVREAMAEPASAAATEWVSAPFRQDEPDATGPIEVAAAPSLPGRTAPLVAPPWHRFPRGSAVGNFLHDQLEWLAEERFGLARSMELQRRLCAQVERLGWGEWSEPVLDWLVRVCEQPLPPLNAALSDLEAARPEMEFWFPSDGLSAQQVDHWCREHLFPGAARPQLRPHTLRGMFMGFADLIFVWKGRYGVIDYKSNTLGPDGAAYSPAAMTKAVLENRYDVQAALYQLALHRMLKVRLGPRYRPAEHLRGMIFYFLRGIDGPAGGCCTVDMPMAMLESLDARWPGRES